MVSHQAMAESLLWGILLMGAVFVLGLMWPKYQGYLPDFVFKLLTGRTRKEG